jgi:hypothetical protein
VASPNAGAPGAATRRSGPGALAPRHLACDPKGAQTQPQALWFIDAAGRVPVARRPAYAPALNPPEGVWAYLQGVERRKGCGVDLPPRRRDLGDAVQRVCRPWRVIAGFFRGAKLSFFNSLCTGQ